MIEPVTTLKPAVPSMRWKYSQSTGQCFDPKGNLLMYGWSGQKAGLNNPQCQEIHGIGPIPRGVWKMVAYFANHPSMGLGVIQLIPDTGTQTFGRFGFFIHGLAIRNPLASSEGCIVIGDEITRAQMWKSECHEIEVTA